MRIETNTVSITRKDFFNILLRRAYSGRWSLWIILVLLAGVGISAAVSKGDFAILGVVLLLAASFFAYTPLSILRYVNSAETANFYAKRSYVITAETLAVRLESGTVSEFDFSKINKAVRYGRYYLLFLSPQQYFYIPSDCFKTVEDGEGFSELLIEKKLL
jgi:hypothetical protein